MVPGTSKTYLSEKPFGRFEPDLRIYCYRGQEKNILIMFQTLRFRIAIDGDDFSQFEGESPEEVREQYDNQRTIFSFSMMNTGKRTLIKINPFNQTCIGIETPQRYTIYLNAVRFDIEQVLMLVVGLLLFYYARMCSQTPLFYYLTGILLGIFASVLVAVYFVSKLFPKVTHLSWPIYLTLNFCFGKIRPSRIQQLFYYFRPIFVVVRYFRYFLDFL